MYKFLWEIEGYFIVIPLWYPLGGRALPDLTGDLLITDISTARKIQTPGDEENRNHGYGSEAMSLLISFGFNYLNLHNIMLFHLQ